jgi:transcriptional regulator with XRE-family HTH domain
MQRGDPAFLLARAKNIRRALDEKKWTQKRLAEKTGYSERTLRRAGRGAANGGEAGAKPFAPGVRD